jgi:flagellar biosynthesis protein FlhA
MKTDKPIENRKDRKLVLALAALAAMLAVSVPSIMLDILITADLILALLALLAVFFTGIQGRIKNDERKILSKSGAYPFLPAMSFVCALLGLSICSFSTRLILVKGDEVDSKIISFVSGLVRADGTAGIIAGFFGLIMLSVVPVCITRYLRRITETATRFFLDSMPGKMMNIETKYACGAISEEMSIRQKENIGKQSDFLGAMDGMGKFIADSVKVAIVSMTVTIFGGLIIGTKIHGQTIQGAAKTFLAAAIALGIIFFLILLLVSVAAGVASLRACLFDKRRTPEGTEKP